MFKLKQVADILLGKKTFLGSNQYINLNLGSCGFVTLNEKKNIKINSIF